MSKKIRQNPCTSTPRAYTRTQARGATPELQRVAQTPHPTACVRMQAFHTDRVIEALPWSVFLAISISRFRGGGIR